MIENMLRAISKMIANSKEPEVKCAKVIIDEIIVGMTKSPVVESAPEQPAPIQTKKSSEKEGGRIEVGADGIIKSITGVSPDSFIELANRRDFGDAIRMKCSEAIGKPLKYGRLV